jgi:hypothetical protein
MSTIYPTLYVKHPDGSFTQAEPRDIPGAEEIERLKKIIHDQPGDDRMWQAGHAAALDSLEQCEAERDVLRERAELLEAEVERLRRIVRRRPDAALAEREALELNSDEEGIVIDALVEHAASARRRKDVNSASTSDVRAEICERIIRRITAKYAALAGTPEEKTNDADD